MPLGACHTLSNRLRMYGQMVKEIGKNLRLTLTSRVKHTCKSQAQTAKTETELERGFGATVWGWGRNMLQNVVVGPVSCVVVALKWVQHWLSVRPSDCLSVRPSVCHRLALCQTSKLEVAQQQQQKWIEKQMPQLVASPKPKAFRYLSTHTHAPIRGNR